MTVANETNVVGPYTGDDSTTAFAVGIKVFAATDLVVERTNADATVDTLTYGVDYSVSLNADQNASPGGTVTYPISGTELSTNETLTITREVDLTQTTEITNLGGFYPDVIENLADRLVMMVQQLATGKLDLDGVVLQSVVAGDFDSEGATDGYVFTADGADGAAFEALPGLSDQAATTANPINIAGGVVGIDVEALTTIEGNALAATDTFYVEDGGVPKGVEVQAAGMRVQTGQTTQTLAAADMNSIMEFTGTATLTLPLNSSVPLPVGVPIVLNVKHATQVLTVTAAASVTLVTVNHPAGVAAASDSVDAGGSAILYKTAADVWAMSGDISD